MKNKRDRLKKLEAVYEGLFKVYGKLSCSLDHENPLQLMVATILSAQCTDIRVNLVTAQLFKKYSDVKSFANAKQDILAEAIKPAGLHQSKSKNIILACQKIINEYNGEVPSTLDELVTLPGIGRKTANVVLGDAFNVPGFPVDTHVKRLLNLIGVVKSDNPVKVEKDVIEVMAEEHWTNFSHLLIIHGRNKCKARTPNCTECEIQSLCKFGKNKKG